ncbi:MAG: aspartate kinase [Candidatus Acidiferrales bacterium]
MTRQLQVMKFGGTSVGSAERIRSAAGLAANAARERDVVVVVSAMSGVTNALIDAAHRSARGDQNAWQELSTLLTTKHHEALRALISDPTRRERMRAELDGIIEEASNRCRGVSWLGELTPRVLDAISGVGERLSARLVSGTLVEMGVPSSALEATDFLITDDVHGGAQPLEAQTRERAQTVLLPRARSGVVPVVTGFIGSNESGVPTTLGRGGSDYSATILGAAIDADDIIIWTDVDGVLTADPRLVPEASLLEQISYNEAAELAFFGAKVLHPSTLHPVRQRGIPVWIRNSFAPERRGTVIAPNGNPSQECTKAVTAMRDVTLLTVGGPGIIGVPDVAAWTFAATAEARARILLITQASSQDDICFVVPSSDAGRTVEALRRTFLLGVRPVELEHIQVNDDVAIVAVVGDKMRGTPGIAGRVFSRLGREGVNLIAIAQGSSENNISFVVEERQMQRAVAAVHDEFHLARLAAPGEKKESAQTDSASRPEPAVAGLPGHAGGLAGGSAKG